MKELVFRKMILKTWNLLETTVQKNLKRMNEKKAIRILEGGPKVNPSSRISVLVWIP